MTYATHFASLLDAFFRARPDVSQRELSFRAGHGRGFLSEFGRRRSSRIDKIDEVVAVIERLCPEGQEGDELRRLLAIYRAAPPYAPREHAA